jgi:uncharacterized protein YjiK
MRSWIFSVSLIAVLLLSFKGTDVPSASFSFEHFKSLNGIPEPSDIVYDKATDHFLIVSDHGILFECSRDGKIITRAKEEGMDFEGVEIKGDYVYVSDETPRKVYKYRRKDLSLEKVYQVSFSGAMNKAFESIAYNETKHCFVMVSQQPAVIYEYKDDFTVLNKYSFKYARDISAARWYQGYFYLLSNKDRCIFKCDPETYEVKEVYPINVLNPEGLAFDDKGNVAITSDDLQRIYFFKNLPSIQVQ